MESYDDDLTPDERALFAGDEFETGWDQETGKPGLITLPWAVQVWALCQAGDYAGVTDRKNRGDVSVRQAADGFNCDPRMIIGAVKAHPSMRSIAPR